jgi:hypothetical protein
MRNLGGNRSGEGRCVIQTDDGGYAVAGWTDTNGNCLVRTDSAGRIIWEAHWSGGDSSRGANAALQTSDGGFAVAGAVLVGPHDREAAYLTRLDPSGNLVWKKVISDSGQIRGYALLQTEDGGYGVSGMDIWGDAIVLIKTDSLGNRLWTQRYPVSFSPCELEQHVNVPLLRTADKGYIIGTKLLVKVDSFGRQQWMMAVDGLHRFYSIAQALDGGYVAAGTMRHVGDSSLFQSCLVKFRQDGRPVWLRRYGGSGISEGFWVTNTVGGGYAVAGENETNSRSFNDGYLAGVDSRGSITWSESLPVSEVDCICRTKDGCYAVTGYYYDEPTNDDMMYLLKTAPERMAK